MMSYSKRVSFFCLCLGFVCAVSIAAPLGLVGLSAKYKLVGDVSGRPEFERNGKLTVTDVTLSLGPVEKYDGQNAQWLKMSFTRLNGQTYSLWALCTKWPTGDSGSGVLRYLWQEPKWKDAVEYVHWYNNKPIISQYLWKYGWPRNIDGKLIAPKSAMPEVIRFQGYKFKQIGKQTSESWKMPVAITKVKLDPDLRIGYIVRKRDIFGRPSDTCPQKKYQMKKVDDRYLRNQIAAGYNVSRVCPEWLNRSSCWISGGSINDWPAQFYRSNFDGWIAWIDEPGYHNVKHYRKHPELAGKLTPSESAKNIRKLNFADFGKKKKYMHAAIAKKFGVGDLKIVENSFYTWEYIWPAAWYQMAENDGTPGMVDEDDETTSLVCLLNMAFGTQIPPTIENACAIRTATFRGACRNFDKKWGVSVYFPTEFQKKLTAIKYFYDKGASYIRAWNCFHSGERVHVPYTYQRMLAQAARAAQRANPDRDMKKLLFAAKTAIVLPYGYTFYYTPLHRVELLHLERVNKAGKTYREVLSSVAEQVEYCLRNGIEFDIVVDDPTFNKKGYDELIYVKEDASVEIVNVEGEKSDKGLKNRDLFRPALGAGPRIKLEISPEEDNVPCIVRLSATPSVGSGEVAVDAIGRPLVYFEVFTPQNGFIRIDPKGTTAEFKAWKPGKYRVRASSADSFGRPAAVWKEIELKPSSDAMVLPSIWHFSRDTKNVGVAGGWFKKNFDDSAWRRCKVGKPWESIVGRYDGYGWYRVKFQVPQKLQNKSLSLFFDGVDEQAWVYLDGKYIGERTTTSTGKTTGQIWSEPFRVNMGKLSPGSTHVLAIRVHDCGRAGGIYRMVRVEFTPK